MRLKNLFLVLFAILIMPPTTSGAGTYQRVESKEPTFDAARGTQRMLKLINRARRDEGLQPLQLDQAVCDVARGHSEDMLRRGFYDHLTPEGYDPTHRARTAGLPFFLAENIGISLCGSRTQDEVIDAFMERFLESPPHRKNILDPDVTHLGLGFAWDSELRHPKFKEMMPEGYRGEGLGGLFVSQEFFKRSIESWSPKRFPKKIRRGSTLQFSGLTAKGLKEVSVAIENERGAVSPVPTNCDGRGHFSALIRFDIPGKKRVLLLAPEKKSKNTYVTLGEFNIRVH